MRAMVFRAHGGIDRLEPADIPAPTPGPGEALVRVRACALNHLDLWMRQGLPGVSLPMPHISGCDVAGDVAALGPGAAGPWKAGQPVVIAPGLSCRACPACAAGRDSACDRFRILGFQVQGGYAEFVSVPAENLLPLPPGLSVEEAAAVPLVSLTAYHMLMTRAGLRPLETVLVMSAGSGVGTAAIQIARAAGARVLAAAGSEEKRRRALELGADAAIDYTRPDWTAEVLRATEGRGVSVLVDSNGGDLLAQGLRTLARYGRAVTCGATAGGTLSFDLRPFYQRQASLSGAFMGARWELAEVMKLVAAGRLKPVVDRVFPLAEARAAQQHMLDRKNFGKIVLRVD